MYFRNKFSQKEKHIKISVKSSRFVSCINFENKLIPYIPEHRFLAF